MPEWRQRVQEMRLVKPDELLDHPFQHRMHRPEQRAHLVGILDEIGIAGALLAWYSARNGGALTAIDGHLRKSLDPEVPWPTLITDLSDAEADILLLAYDWIGAQAQSGREELARLMGQVQPQTTAVQALQAHIAEQAGLPWGLAAAAPKEAPEPQVDRAAELQAQWGTERGQLWVIDSQTVPGQSHRLLCGDSTQPEALARLMGQARGAALVTDPPFNVGFNYGTGFDDARDVEVYGTWLWAIIERAEGYLHEPWRAFVWQAMPTCRYWATWFPREYRLFAGLKDFVQFRPTAIQFSWDPILFWSSGQSAVPPVAGKRDYFLSQTSQFIRQESNGHPCPRPIDVCVYLLGELGEPGAVVDPFLGSGTTMMASEQTARLCYGLEIEPPYVAVTLQRMSDMGLTPRLLEAHAHA